MRIEYWDMGGSYMKKITSDDGKIDMYNIEKGDLPEEMIDSGKTYYMINEKIEKIEADFNKIEEKFEKVKEINNLKIEEAKNNIETTEEELNIVKEKTKENTVKEEMVNHPSHYQGILIKGKNGEMEFEAIEIIESILNHINLPPAASFDVGNDLKYILRCGKKNIVEDQNFEDIDKHAWYASQASKSFKSFKKS